MADLFDVRVGGAGWHLTSHLIAIAALFVACFAITGYITFRDDSIPAKALNDSGDADQDLTVNDITATGTLSVTGNTTLSGDLSAKVLAFQTGVSELADITPTAVTNTTVDSGFTAVVNTAYASAWLADSGSAITLPSATVGSLITWRQTAAADGGSSLVITRNANDTFNVNQTVGYQPIGAATAVGSTSTAVAANNTLTIVTNANGGWGGIGSTLTFYCATNGVWSVNIPLAVGNGTSAAGSVAFSTV